ncbi:hypothetical protein [Pelagibaculum spongiae]|uniref:Uncharacterized protein n=1 Tax=Pelagibaculum spongiae TaxID=2080658 RepID=A0A2V1H0D3_9GAMM|nr:hypothetical protein [Pelagibaculum spongiae]PVZ69523.1 hypothetical protein DC094_09340 [Pelagibaculum spongiae]
MKSPDEKHIAELKYKSEIRFGPAYFTLTIDDAKIKNRIFGHKLQWSDDSRYLAAEEWLTTDSQEGPIIRVTLFDISFKRISEFQKIEKGFAGDFRFEGDVLVYKKYFHGKGIIKEVEVNINTINNWVNTSL